MRPPFRVHNLLILFLSLAPPATAKTTSVTVELPNGAAYALDVRMLPSSDGLTSAPYVTWSGVRYVLREYDNRTQWDSDVRTGLLRLAVGDQRFSFPSGRAVVVVNEKMVPVSLPLRSVENETWMPVETFRLLARSLTGLQIPEPVEPPVAVNTGTTSAPIIQSPDQVLQGAILPSPIEHTGPSSGTLDLPPSDSVNWRVVFDPAFVDARGEGGESIPALKPALSMIAERCLSILNDEGSMEAFSLTEHDAATSPDVILGWLSQRPADLIVILRVEISPLRAVPGYTIYYADESVDWIGYERQASTTPSSGTISREQNYLPFQLGSRRMAEKIGVAMAEPLFARFQDQVTLPVPMYLLKRCPARAVMITFAFPERSPDLVRLSDSGFRESLARVLAGALISFRRENVITPGERPSPEGAG